ncbi:MAG: efflux RND transporter periplasmic adaptor subunit [Deltaproteobacteria bacterium]|nr:efflux RND transporter periplasmic adaptor subunit [Deltaproteobacteria bacterium]
MKRKAAYFIPFVILAVGFAAMQFFASFKTAPPKKKPEEPVKSVEVSTVRLTDIPAAITAYGRVVSAQPVTLYSEVTGTLEPGDLPFLPGQSFRRGELLLKVDTRQIALDIKSAKSELMTALALVLPEIKVDFPEHYPAWQNYFNSCRFDRPIAALPPAGNEKIKLYLARFNIYKIYFTICDLEILLEKHFFRAPFDGAITDAELRPGSSARPGTRLGEIINLENLEAEMPVPAEDAQWIDLSKPVTLTSEEVAGTWSGRILRVGKTIDAKTQTVQIYIGVGRRLDDGLYDGVFIKAVVAGSIIPSAAIVPRKALYEQQFVYVVKDGRLEYRKVRIVRREPDYVIAAGGLNNGDLLVVDMLQGVAPGMRARPRNLSAGEKNR